MLCLERCWALPAFPPSPSFTCGRDVCAIYTDLLGICLVHQCPLQSICLSVFNWLFRITAKCRRAVLNAFFRCSICFDVEGVTLWFASGSWTAFGQATVLEIFSFLISIIASPRRVAGVVWNKAWEKAWRLGKTLRIFWPLKFRSFHSRTWSDFCVTLSWPKW